VTVGPPGRRVSIGFKTSPQGVDWTTLDETWAAAGELPVFDTGWLNDHLTDLDEVSPGPSFESLTLLATLVHRVPGRWVGHGVLSNTFRRPVILAKAATVLDHATGGRFILGLGAGWFEGEHEPFGIRLPPPGERIDRLESAVGVLQAMFSEAAFGPPGVTRADPFYPLVGATNLPPPIQPGGPALVLGGQKPRGIALAARAADGWILPGLNAGDATYVAARRDELMRAMEAIGRDPTGFAVIGQVHVGDGPGWGPTAIASARDLVAAGTTHIVLGIRASAGPDFLRRVAGEVGEPLREAFE
jgi:alkanesulfonate monooxygenase SsuD/methylene tetrahydromethanopterin reductase-like flavin-dependent oxidoreductase (luciferase family)